jgi:hypothetical protein
MGDVGPKTTRNVARGLPANPVDETAPAPSDAVSSRPETILQILLVEDDTETAGAHAADAIDGRPG